MNASLPLGTVTLLFTDIEGSSTLWDEHRSAMATALTRHNELLTEVITSHDGHIVKDKGDGFFAAFGSAWKGLTAAIDAQRMIATATWPAEIGDIRVRMALHTGSVEPDGADYRGPTVNRVARIEALAFGGQVLVSEATRALVADGMPPDVGLRDLGSHSLRGLSRPERIFQLEAPGLETDFPDLPTAAGNGVSLPSYLTSFVGRGDELATIEELFHSEETRLVTLLGPGGIGKTRLAVEAARLVGADLGGDVYFADLARVASPGDVGLAIAEAVGAHPEGTASPIALAAARVSQPALVVLDNFEHVQEAAPLVAELLGDSNSVQLLATSRSPLHIGGERVFRVEPLPARSSNGDQPPAVALFRERATGYGVEAATLDAAADSISSIVARLDGLPLAIELVAARTRLMSIPELEKMLAESLDALGAGATDLPDRQRTIRSTIEWSLQALTSQQRSLFSHAAIFPAGATLAQLEAIEKEIPKAQLLEELAALVDNSLINVVTGLPGGTRYRQLVLLRDYGRERLEAAGALHATMNRLVDYYVEAAPGLAQRLQHGDAAHWELAADHANLLGAMSWSLDHGRMEAMVGVMSDLWVYWFNGDVAGSALDWVAAVDPLLDSPDVDWLAGFLALQLGDAPTAVERLWRAKQRFEEAGNPEWVARSQTFLSFFIEDAEEARATSEAAAEYFDQFEPSADLFLARLMVSSYHFRRGDFRTSASIRRDLLSWAEEVSYVTLVAWAQWNLALALLADGDLAAGQVHNRMSLDMMVTAGSQEGVASAADIEAAVQMTLDNDELGVLILGGAEAVWDTLGTMRWPEAGFLVDAALTDAVRRLGREEVDRIRAEGRNLDLGDLIDLIQTAPTAPTRELR